MNERPDDTTKTGPESRDRGRYYYDDATGYEVYVPGGEEEDEDDDAGVDDEGGEV